MEYNDKNQKPFFTYEQQVDKLLNEKGLEIKNKQYAIKLLKRFSYFDLISGYKQMFKDKKGKYKLHTSIEDIYALYCFDDELRSVFLKYILKIEKYFKSLISYAFCEEYGEEQMHYLNATNYNYIERNQDEINKLVCKLNSIIDNSRNYPYITHQKKKYGSVPLWVLIKAVPIGTVSKMYSLLPQKIQYCVSKEFEYVNEGMMVQMIDLLSRVRNVCAHNERLYDYKYLKGTIDDTDVHRIMNVPSSKGLYTKGKKDLFAVIIVLKYLLDEDEFVKMIEEVSKTIDGLFSKTKAIQRNQLMKKMGFPENWKDIKECGKSVNSNI